MRFVAGTVLVLAVHLVGVGFAHGQKILQKNPYYLRADPKLQVSLNVEAEHPKLSQIVANLRDATGLDIAVGDDLQNHSHDYGIIQPSQGGYRAWQIMEIVTQKDLQQGYWEKTERGYRLVGTSTAAVAPTGPEDAQPDDSARRVFGDWLIALAGSLFVVLLVLVALRRKAVRSR